MKQLLVIALFTLFCQFSCNIKEVNHIDRYEIDLHDLKALPNNFYAYHRGKVLINHRNKFILWFNMNEDGDIEDFAKLQWLSNTKRVTNDMLKPDTLNSKAIAQIFVNLSRKFKFGHIHVDKSKKISFSTNPDISEQYVRPLNDSVRAIYSEDHEFRRLENGWFELVD